MPKNLKMRYDAPAENSDNGWERQSLPIGNGYFGASVFGGTDTERVQFTTNVFANDYSRGGVSNFAELYIDFGADGVKNYERTLDLSKGTAESRYVFGGIKVNREAFYSYPDRVFVYRITTENGKANFDVRLEIPHLGARLPEDGGREGKVFARNGNLVMRETLPLRELVCEGIVTVLTDGEKKVSDGKISVTGASESAVIFSADTSYKLCEEVFLSGVNKALGDDPHDRVAAAIISAEAMGFEKLESRHVKDYSTLMDRVEFDIGGEDDGRTTDELLSSARDGNFEPYLEELYYMFARHLLVSSSRKGTPPSSLQGVWTVHDKSPWGSGFWHNINVQMNYWLAFNSNLAETFWAYADYHRAYFKQAQINASEWIKETNPENYDDGDGNCGWIIGTGAYCYEIEGRNLASHSGPGTGGLTSKLFWDWYDFTRDKEIFTKYTYPAIHGMSKFLTKCVRNYDGRRLCSFSASPEQILSGSWVKENKKQQYYHTVGCAFDQQMLYENACDDIKCSEISGKTDKTVESEKQNLNNYYPVQVGYSGQIKEYDEENFYGEIGEAKHRHISQLVALMPGTQITHETPAWLDSARRTLEMRGDESTGWALAHRLCAWARTGDGNHAYSLLRMLLAKRTYPNLWDVHPPFQIDGNFGAAAGITEMLLQSHEEYIALLPAIPNNWNSVRFKGLKARGNFTVSCEYADGKIVLVEIESVAGETANVKAEENDRLTVTDKSGNKVKCTHKGNIISFETRKGEKYILTGFGERHYAPAPDCVRAEWTENGVLLKWHGENKTYAVFRAVENDKDYTLIAKTNNTEYVDKAFDSNNKARLTYKIVSADCKNISGAHVGATAFLDPASDILRERYLFRFKTNNLNL